MTKTSTALLRLIALVTATLALYSAPASAGCGCEKAPPAIASVRPNMTFPGSSVTLFHPALQDGAAYTVSFHAGTTDYEVAVEATAAVQRDLADGIAKAQLMVELPRMPLGPAAIKVSGPGVELVIDDADFTVIPDPVLVSNANGPMAYFYYRAAVSRAGTVYVTLDLSEITDAKTIQAWATEFPLRFTADDVVFYNAEGFLMQLLDENMPGLFAIASPRSSRDSDKLQYSRHEFNSYFVQHEERQAHDVDTDDPRWHLDGTPHIDHTVMVLEIAGRFDDGSLPTPGETPFFTFMVDSQTLFSDGVVALDGMAMAGTSVVDSFDSRSTSLGANATIVSNGVVTLMENAEVHGDVAATDVICDADATISGTVATLQDALGIDGPLVPLAVNFPSNLPSLGRLVLQNAETKTLTGPGSFAVSSLELAGDAQLTIDNSEGPVTLYVTGDVSLANNAAILPVHEDPERLAIYVRSGTIKLTHAAALYGVVYAPDSAAALSGDAEIFGALVTRALKMAGNATVHYDTQLRTTDWWGILLTYLTQILPTDMSFDSGTSTDWTMPSYDSSSHDSSKTPTTTTLSAPAPEPTVTAAPEPTATPTPEPTIVPASDTVTITKASYSGRKDKLRVFAQSDEAGAVLSVTIEGFVTDATMRWNDRKSRYQYVVSTATNLDGREVTVSSDLGGSATAIVD